MDSARFNKEGLIHAPSPEFESKIHVLQRADFVFSRIQLKPGEVLMVKLAAHMRPGFQEILNVVSTVFGKDADRVVVFFEDEIEFSKYVPANGD